MTKQELVAYLNGLLALMESRDTAGRPRGEMLVGEYEHNYAKLIEILRKETADETRNRQ